MPNMCQHPSNGCGPPNGQWHWCCSFCLHSVPCARLLGCIHLFIYLFILVLNLFDFYVGCCCCCFARIFRLLLPIASVMFGFSVPQYNELYASVACHVRVLPKDRDRMQASKTKSVNTERENESISPIFHVCLHQMHAVSIKSDYFILFSNSFLLIQFFFRFLVTRQAKTPKIEVEELDEIMSPSTVTM